MRVELDAFRACRKRDSHKHTITRVHTRGFEVPTLQSTGNGWKCTLDVLGRWKQRLIQGVIGVMTPPLHHICGYTIIRQIKKDCLWAFLHTEDEYVNKMNILYKTR